MSLLKLKMAKTLLIPDGTVEAPAKFVCEAISICENLETLSVENNDLSLRYITAILKQVNKRDKNIKVIVSSRSFTLWKRAISAEKLRHNKCKLCYEDDSGLSFDLPSPASPSDKSLIPASLQQFCREDNYQAFKEMNISAITINRNNADGYAEQFGTALMESVLVFENICIFATSVDVFLHHKRIDDCAYRSNETYAQPVAKLKEKYQMGKSYHEVSIFFDRFELLIIGGWIGEKDGRMEPFVGSSVPLQQVKKAITSNHTTDIYTCVVPPSTFREERLLRQYYKTDAKRLWSFHSMRFRDEGLYPINPLHVKNHPVVSSETLLECTSFLLEAFAYQEIDRAKIGDLLDKVRNDDKLKKKLTFSADELNTFSDWKSLSIAKKGSHNVIFNTLAELEGKESVDYFKDDKKTKIKLKETVLNIGKNGFLKIKRLNQKNLKIIKKNINKQYFVLPTKKPTLILSF